MEAAPFRAHVRHLMAVGEISGDVVAQMAGVSPRITRHLLAGRAGRAMRRISPDVARRLFHVTPSEARAVHYRAVPAATAARRMRRLLAGGCTVDDLTWLLRVRSEEVTAIVDEQVTVCTQLVALRVAALAFAATFTDDPGSPARQPLFSAA